MSYKCQLKTENFEYYRNIIRDLVKDMRRSRSVYLACLVLVWYYEVFCSYHYIDSDEDVKWEGVEKLMNLKGSARTVAYLLNTFRNRFTHNIGFYYKDEKLLNIMDSIFTNLQICYEDDVTGKAFTEFCEFFGHSLINSYDVTREFASYLTECLTILKGFKVSTVIVKNNSNSQQVLDGSLPLIDELWNRW